MLARRATFDPQDVLRRVVDLELAQTKLRERLETQANAQSTFEGEQRLRDDAFERGLRRLKDEVADNKELARVELQRAASLFGSLCSRTYALLAAAGFAWLLVARLVL